MGRCPKLAIPSKWVAVFVFGVYLARICQGIGASMIGPTLLYLSKNLATDVKSVSPVFTGRALGVLVGSILSSFFIQRGRPLISLAIAVLLLGLSFFLIPFMRSVVLLFITFVCFGIVYGFLDAGQQGLILKLWGEKDSRPHIQGYHLAFTIGGVLGPMIIRPFLIMGKSVRNDSTVCPGNYTAEGTVPYNMSGTQNQLTPDTFNPIGFSYILSAVFMMIVSVWYGSMGWCKTDTRIKRDRKVANLNVETRPQRDLKDIWWILLPVVLYYFFLIGSEHSYMTYIYSIVVCEFKLTESDGSILNTLFWVGMLCGRCMGTLVAGYLLPATIILVFSCGCLLSLVVLSIFGQIYFIPWVVSFSYSFFVAPLFPAGISWISRIINVSAYIGSGIGSMTLVPISGNLFQSNPMNVLYFNTGMIFCQCLVFGIMKITEHFFTRKSGHEIVEVKEDFEEDKVFIQQ